MAFLPSAPGRLFSINALYILVDLLSANALMRIADSGEASASALLKSSRSDLKPSGLSLGAA